MTIAKPLHDPLGNTIHFLPSFFDRGTPRIFEEIRPVITHPSFVILEKGKALYFFRLLNEDVNLLIETRKDNGDYLAIDCIENPSVDYISSLLQRGSLFCFPGIKPVLNSI